MDELTMAGIGDEYPVKMDQSVDHKAVAGLLVNAALGSTESWTGALFALSAAMSSVALSAARGDTTTAMAFLGSFFGQQVMTVELVARKQLAEDSERAAAGKHLQ